MKRTHHCNELRAEHAGQTVTLTGWVHSRRDLGGLLFIDLRDREGRTQTVFDPADMPKEIFEVATHLHSESVIEISGKVRARPAGTNNDKIPTGHVEVMVQSFTVLNNAEILPFPVDDPEIASKVNEELRLQYRYLDLRRPEMIRNLRVRSKVAIATRSFMDEQGFLEVETPVLQPIYGGAAARPFVTHHNQLDQDLFLRISFELYPPPHACKIHGPTMPLVPIMPISGENKCMLPPRPRDNPVSRPNNSAINSRG